MILCLCLGCVCPHDSPNCMKMVCAQEITQEQKALEEEKTQLMEDAKQLLLHKGC